MVSLRFPQKRFKRNLGTSQLSRVISSLWKNFKPKITTKRFFPLKEFTNPTQPLSIIQSITELPIGKQTILRPGHTWQITTEVQANLKEKGKRYAVREDNNLKLGKVGMSVLCTATDVTDDT